jgi:hypothetical protein
MVRVMVADSATNGKRYYQQVPQCQRDMPDHGAVPLWVAGWSLLALVCPEIAWHFLGLGLLGDHKR